ncbi:MAG: antibiotic biosynthesis monooxygenase [Methanobacteriota archaeon]
MILSILKISPMPDKRQAVIEILMSVGTMTRLKHGCMGSDIYEQSGDRQKILYIEKWQSKEDMHRHIRSDLYLRVLNAIELANEPPEICFHEGSETTGIELIEAIRTESKVKGDT